MYMYFCSFGKNILRPVLFLIQNWEYTLSFMLNNFDVQEGLDCPLNQ